MNEKIIYLVHCVDTEGPKYETLEATFERLQQTFGISMAPSQDNLEMLREGKGVSQEISSTVIDFLDPVRMAYNEDWDAIDDMVDTMMSDKWRNQYMDDFGRGYVFNWYCLDHVGFSSNPRGRAMGYHAVFDRYLQKVQSREKTLDEVHWHHHPVSFTREGHKCSNSFSYTNEHLQILSRRVLDYGWFPVSYRPGQHTERPDINLFLEQWIPFDYGNQSMPESVNDTLQADLGSGRYGDWRRATRDWEVYHPDYRDYQLKGDMRRYIARCLNLNSRIRKIDETEIRRAFARADQGLPTIMSVTDHDEREMRVHIDGYYQTIKKVQTEFPEVKIKNARAVEAMRATENIPNESPAKFDIDFKQGSVCLDISLDKAIWGPQPYFCFKTVDGEYIHENLDFHGGNHWSYEFDEGTIDLALIKQIGLATNDETGNTSVATIDVDNREVTNYFYEYR